NEEEQEGENGGNENGGNKGNGNGDNGGNRENGNGDNRGNGNHGMNFEGLMPMARECTFPDFLKCKPHTFSGTEGVELIVFCTRMVPDEEDRVERFIGWLPDNIQGNVMAILVISVSSDSSEDSVGRPAGRTDIIEILTEIPIIAPIIPPSPDYRPASPNYSLASETESDPSEDSSSGHIPPLPARSPVIPRHRVIILAPRQPIPHGRPYRYYPNGPVHMMTVRKRVGPLPFRQLSVRHSIIHSSSDSSSRHSLSDHSSPDLSSTSVGPSRKRRRSPMTSVHALPHVSRALSPVRADLIPSPKRVRDIGYLADVEVGPRETRVEKVTHPAMPKDIPEPAQEGAVESEQGYRIVGVESAVAALTERVVKLERDNMRLRGTTSVESKRVDRLQRGMSRMQSEMRQMKMPNTRSRASMTHEEVEELVARRVAEEMEARESARNLETLNENEEEQEGENGGNGNGDNGGNKNGGNRENGNRDNRGNGNHGMNYEGFMPMARECTFHDFLKCKPHTFSRIEGVVKLTHWFEKIETVFNIGNCPPKYQVKYATCTLQTSDLTWWNSQKRTIGVDAAYAMKWAGLMKLITEVYCSRNEVQKMETKLWNLTVKGNDLTAYTQRFQELILLCTRMVPDEDDIVERFIGGLPDNIQGNVIAANPTRLQDAIHVANQKDCPMLRSQNRGNQTRNKTGGNEVTATAYSIGGGGTNPDSIVVMGTFLLNNCYASMLFNSVADRSFVSTTFSPFLNVTPTTLDTSYAVELADGRVSESDIILRGCRLGLLGHPFNIDLMPVELGSFNVIIDNSCISAGANRYKAHATSAAPGTKSIWNLTCRACGNPGKSSRNSRTIDTSSNRFSSDLSSTFLDVTCAR
nr:hypothetical protein [Tanacetum cinerariifolium]